VFVICKGEVREFFDSKKVHKEVTFSSHALFLSLSLPPPPSFIPSFLKNVSKTTRYVFATQVYNSPRKAARDSCFTCCFLILALRREEAWEGGRSCMLI
jgi:hypothetical protein